MKISKARLFMWKVRKTKLHWRLAICILVLLVSCNEIDQLKRFLTPKSVSVSGYTRKDGTHVSGYSRRPPGGAAHDRPYESKFFWYRTASFIVLVIFGFGIYYFINLQKEDIEELLGNRALKKLNFQIDIKQKPYKLVNTRISRFRDYSSYFIHNYNCSVCGVKILEEEFHISSRRKRSPKKWCLKCASGTLVRDEITEINEYLKSFRKLQGEFREALGRQFRRTNGFTCQPISAIDEIFYDEIIRYRLKNEDG